MKQDISKSGSASET